MSASEPGSGAVSCGIRIRDDRFFFRDFKSYELQIFKWSDRENLLQDQLPLFNYAVNKDSSRCHIQIFSRLRVQSVHKILHEHCLWNWQLWTRHGKLFISGPGCSQTLPFLLLEAHLISKINGLGQWEEGKTELILQWNPTAMTIPDMKFVPLFCPSH